MPELTITSPYVTPESTPEQPYVNQNKNNEILRSPPRQELMTKNTISRYTVLFLKNIGCFRNVSLSQDTAQKSTYCLFQFFLIGVGCFQSNALDGQKRKNSVAKSVDNCKLCFFKIYYYAYKYIGDKTKLIFQATSMP